MSPGRFDNSAEDENISADILRAYAWDPMNDRLNPEHELKFYEWVGKVRDAETRRVQQACIDIIEITNNERDAMERELLALRARLQTAIAEADVVIAVRRLRQVLGQEEA